MSMRLGVTKKSIKLICDIKDKLLIAEEESIKNNTIKVPKEEALSKYLPTEELYAERVINLMHNNKGFQKEIIQLKKSLKDRISEREFLINELRALRSEFKSFGGNNEFELTDLQDLLEDKQNGIINNRNRLRDLVLLRIELNDNIFEVTKRVKVLEGKLMMCPSSKLDKEKKELSKELRGLLVYFEEDNQLKVNNLKMEICQKERLKASLYGLLEDLNDKIKFVQNQIYEQSIIEFPSTPKTNSRRQGFSKSFIMSNHRDLEISEKRSLRMVQSREKTDFHSYTNYTVSPNTEQVKRKMLAKYTREENYSLNHSK
mmetsp:Transcript_17948/g.15859  ORF Transcript_17948/g.15859 Transcript_17948/m.15859 type:complete len:316 (-) Transcript_17948:374-1321(-)